MKYVIGIVVVGLIGWFGYSQFIAPTADAPVLDATETSATTEAAPADENYNTTRSDRSTEAAPADTPAAATADEPTAAPAQPARDDLDADDDGLETAVAADADATVEPTERTFTLDSFNFGYSMDTIEVNEGDTVTINLTSSDGFHDWVVDEFDAATGKIREGETTSVTFVADTAGTYEFYCSVGSHRAQGMVGTLVVN